MRASLRETTVAALVLALAALASFGVAAQLPTALRLPLLMGFLLFCPGTPIVRLLGLGDALVQLGLAIGLSTALDILLPTGLLLGRVWSPSRALAGLVMVTVAGSTTLLLRQVPWSSLNGVWRPGPCTRDERHLPAPELSRGGSVLGLSRLDVFTGLLTTVVLIAWSIPIVRLVDRPLLAALSIGLGLAVGVALRFRAAPPVVGAAQSLSYIATLSVVTWLSWDGRYSAASEAVAEALNVWAPGAMGLTLGLTARPIADFVRTGLSTRIAVHEPRAAARRRSENLRSPERATSGDVSGKEASDAHWQQSRHTASSP